MGDLAETWRRQFPILEDKTYLVSHSLGAVPRQTRDALNEYYDLWARRGIDAWPSAWWPAMLEFNEAIERLIGAEAGTVVPMQNVTRAMAGVAGCFEYTPPRNRVALTSLEFTTTLPFWREQQRLGAEVVTVESDDGVTVPTERLVEAIDDRTLLVVVSHVYFRSGAVQDLAPIVEAAHRAGAYVLADAYQSAGSVPIDVRDLGVDFVVGGSHKWLCGGPGAGWLYVRRDLIPQLRPRLTGWFGLADPFAYQPAGQAPQSEGVLKFLDGTANIPAIYAARQGVQAVLDAGAGPIREHNKQLTSAIVERADHRGMTLRSPRDPDRRSGMVCLDFKGSQQAAEALNERGVAVDWRPDCGLRASVHFYNTLDDVERLFDSLDEIRSGRRG